MSPFGDGFILGTIDYGGKFLFLFDIGFNRAERRYKWETARLQLIGSVMPSRVASRADLRKIAAYLDNQFGVGAIQHRNSASKQLAAFLAELDQVVKAA